MQAQSDVAKLVEMVNGYQATCVLVAGLDTGLLDRLAGSASRLEALAAALGADAASLDRLVNALEVFGIVERRGGEIALTRRGAMFQRGAGGLRDLTTLVGAQYLPAWARIADCVKTGEVAFERAFGTTAWEHRRDHPALDAAFNRVTSGVMERTIVALLEAYDFSNARTVVDVGGGHGNLLAGVLQRYASARGVLFDQPHVVAGAEPVLARAGVNDRCRISGGSFLEAVPAGGDCYLMKHILHNWGDEDAATILRTCGARLHENATLLILESVMPEDNLAAGAPIAMIDLHMMTVLGGRERTLRQYEALLAAADLSLVRRVVTRPHAPDVLEVRRRGAA